MSKLAFPISKRRLAMVTHTHTHTYTHTHTHRSALARVEEGDGRFPSRAEENQADPSDHQS